MTHPSNTLSLVADIGGTNTRVALANGLHVLPATIRRYANRDWASLSDVLGRYIADENGVAPKAACVAVAGPVHDGSATMTNLDWTMDTATLALATKTDAVAIVNDLQAQGYALGHIADAHLKTIVTGPKAAKNATMLVVGVGTGFNTAPVFETVHGRYVAASESGHVNLPAPDASLQALSRYLAETHGFASVEDALSGRGLENIYGYLTCLEGEEKSVSAQDIMTACAAGSDKNAQKTVRMFAQILGAVCGNLALVQLPFGGVFLVGGVARAIAPYLTEFGFQQAFCNKGRFGEFMSKFPVMIIEDDYAALTGCAAFLTQN